MGSDLERRIVKVCGILLCLMCQLVPVATKCSKVNSCKCEYALGAVVDLSPLANNDGTPKYMDVFSTDSSTDMFSWNPCYDFIESGCYQVAACQVRQDLPASSYYSLGDQSSAEFDENDNGDLILKYSGNQDGVTRTAVVLLTCTDGSDTLTAAGEQGTDAIYDLELKSPHACPKGGISTGSILIIMLVCCIGLYFLVGIPVQIFVRKESGKRAIPFWNFWIDFPALVKDGALLVASKLRISRSGYERK